MSARALIIHEHFYCNGGFQAAGNTVGGQKSLRRELIERGGSSEAWYGGRASRLRLAALHGRWGRRCAYAACLAFDRVPPSPASPDADNPNRRLRSDSLSADIMTAKSQMSAVIVNSPIIQTIKLPLRLL